MKIDTYDAAVLERIREVCQELFHKNYITEYIFAPNEALKKANDSFSFVTAHYDAIEELLERCGWKLCLDSRAGVLYLTSEYAPAKAILTSLRFRRSFCHDPRGRGAVDHIRCGGSSHQTGAGESSADIGWEEYHYAYDRKVG